jgi:hypothetical protein
MGSNVVYFAWNRSIPGREAFSAAHFDDFVNYVTGLQQAGNIQSFDVALLDTRGGDMNRVFRLHGETAKPDAHVSSAEWITLMTRASLHLDGAGAVRGVNGAAVTERMQLWTATIPR